MAKRAFPFRDSETLRYGGYLRETEQILRTSMPDRTINLYAQILRYCAASPRPKVLGYLFGHRAVTGGPR
jgi:hypothetical protein